MSNYYDFFQHTLVPISLNDRTPSSIPGTPFDFPSVMIIITSSTSGLFPFSSCRETSMACNRAFPVTVPKK